LNADFYFLDAFSSSYARLAHFLSVSSFSRPAATGLGEIQFGAGIGGF